jgi:hypothetical protein
LLGAKPWPASQGGGGLASVLDISDKATTINAILEKNRQVFKDIVVLRT